MLLDRTVPSETLGILTYALKYNWKHHTTKFLYGVFKFMVCLSCRRTSAQMVIGSLGLGAGGSLYMFARAQLRDLLQEMFEPFCLQQ
jgi:hypothetical protein